MGREGTMEGGIKEWEGRGEPESTKGLEQKGVDKKEESNNQEEEKEKRRHARKKNEGSAMNRPRHAH